MGLAPSRSGENHEKLAVAKVPVPIFHSLTARRAGFRPRAARQAPSWPSSGMRYLRILL